MKRITFYLLCFTYLVLPLVAIAETAEEAMKKSQAAFLYAGDDMKARVVMRLIAKDGKERLREMTMLRKDLAEGGDQKYFIYFYQPADVRNMSFMVWKYPKKDDDRWIFIPALNMVRKIAASDRRSSFVGSDFTYEDISGRDIEDDNHSLVKEEKIGERDCLVIKSVPKDEKGTDYSYKLSWVDKEMAALKENMQQEETSEGLCRRGERCVRHLSITKRTMKYGKWPQDRGLF